MDGLECNETLLSAIRDDNGWFRLDSHFYEKQYVQLKKKLFNIPHWFLKDIVAKPIQTGHTPSMKTEGYYNGHIAFIKTDNLHTNQISDSFSDYLTDKGNATIARTSLQESDIITTIIGATEKVIARSALVSSEYLPANINQNIAQIRVKKDIALPEYVSAYLNSKYGRNYLHYLSRQTEQVNLNCQEIGLVIVPKCSPIFQSLVKICIAKANKLQEEAKASFAKAEEILSLQFDVDSFAFSFDNTSVRSIRNSLFTSGRLDAEYYQTKYDEYASLLNTKDTVSTICKIHDKGYSPNDNDKYLYIELTNVGASGEITNVEEFIGKDLPSRAKRRVEAGQVIISSVEGSLQSCAIVPDRYNGALCSTGFYVLSSECINSETLLVLFKSKPIQSLMKQRCSGTILTAISKDELLLMPLPQIDDGIQKEIAVQVQNTYTLRSQAEQLFEYANQAVAIAIEQDEETAMKWLKEKGVEC